MDLREEQPGDRQSVRNIHQRAFGGDHGPVVAPRRLVEVQVLSPLGVVPEQQNRGIASALVRHGLQAVAQQAAPLVFLEGDPGYYSRFGFVPGGDQGFRKPSLRIPDGAFQVFKLRDTSRG